MELKNIDMFWRCVDAVDRSKEYVEKSRFRRHAVARRVRSTIEPALPARLTLAGNPAH
jgi:hypothetical protein